MSRLYSLGMWFCTSMAIALLVLIPLVLPEEVWADTGDCASQCASQCSSYPPGSPEYQDCYNTCMYQCMMLAKCDPAKCAFRKECTMLDKTQCGELLNCGAADGCVNVCSCQPSGAGCDCQQK